MSESNKQLIGTAMALVAGIFYGKNKERKVCDAVKSVCSELVNLNEFLVLQASISRPRSGCTTMVLHAKRCGTHARLKSLTYIRVATRL